jgi:hypothetical protein
MRRRDLARAVFGAWIALAGAPSAFAEERPQGIFQPPEDTESEDPALPAGTIAVDLRDAADAPVAHETITLGVIMNSVANGEKRKHIQLATDENGRAIFSGLETASSVAYRVSSGYQGGAFAATPFQLSQGKAMRVVLHVYPVTQDLSSALIVCDATIAAELRDDRLRIEEVLTIYNLGATAWKPDDVRVSLPTGFSAFRAQASMSDQGVDEVAGSGRLHGTFGPGSHPVEFTWQYPLTGDSRVDFSVGLLPHTAAVRVLIPAAGGVRLEAEGFPLPEVRRDPRGQAFLVTERRMRPDGPRLSAVSVGLRNIPTPGPGRTVAAAVAAFGIAMGLYLAIRRRPAAAPRAGKQAILDELLWLERARETGEVGPKTYEKTRRELIDALALALAGESPRPV